MNALDEAESGAPSAPDTPTISESGTSVIVTYRISDDEIISVSHGVVPLPIEGCATFTTDSSLVDPTRHKHGSGKVVAKTDAEIAAAAQPTLTEVTALVTQQLQLTDAFMVPDRPLPDAVRAAWATYRQALRDLSKFPDAATQLSAWPARPDGTDPTVFLKFR